MLLRQNKIDYVSLSLRNPDPNFPNISGVYQKEFTPAYINDASMYYIYSVSEQLPLEYMQFFKPAPRLYFTGTYYYYYLYRPFYGN